MIIITPKKEMFILIFCIVVLAALCTAVVINGKDLSCSKCQMSFETHKNVYESATGERFFSKFDVNVTDLYYSLLQDDCLVIFDKVDGYIYKNKYEIGNNSQS